MPVTYTPSTFDFAKILVGTTATKVIHVNNTTSAAVSMMTASSVFSASPASVAANTEADVTVSFTPAAVTHYSAILSASPGGAILTGDGVLITIDPDDFDFGDVAVGASSQVAFLVTNKSLTTAAMTVAAPFSLIDLHGQPVSGTGAEVPAGETKYVIVKYTPTAAGNHTGTLTATAGANVATSALQGTGVTDALGVGTVDGAVTRFYLQVPASNTSMTLGKGVNSLTYDGFGASTEGDIFLNALGADSHFWAQSRGDMVLQSFANNVDLMAQKNTTILSAGSTYMVGKGGVYIAAGWGDDIVVADGGAASPPDTKAADTVTSASNAAALGFGILDAFLAFGCFLRGASNMHAARKRGDYNGKLGIAIADGVAIAGALLCSAVGSIGMGAGVIPGVSIFGKGGLLMGTPSFGSLYALGGLVLSSLYPFMVGVDTEVYGLRSASLTGYRFANVLSHSKTTIGSDGDVEINAEGGGGPTWLFTKTKVKKPFRVGSTKHGDVTIKGQDVLIGRSQLAFGDDATSSNVTAGATNIRLWTGASTLLQLGGNDYIYGLAADNIELRVGNFVVLIKTDGIQIGRSPTNAPADAPTEPIFAVDADGIAMSKGDNDVLVADTLAVLGNRSSGNSVMCKADGTYIDGTRVNIG